MVYYDMIRMYEQYVYDVVHQRISSLEREQNECGRVIELS
jgi:hypothetical protein